MKPNKLNEINTNRIRQKIWRSEGISRAEISRDIGLVKSTVTRIVNQLMETNVILEVQETISALGVGRRPLGLKINGDLGYILGLEIQADFYNAVVLNYCGEMIFQNSESLPLSHSSPVETFRYVWDRLEPDLRKLPVALKAIGVAFAGVIDMKNGEIVQSNPYNIFNPVPFIKEVTGTYNIPISVMNDANSCCWGELVNRKESIQGDFIFLLGEFRAGENEIGNNYWGLAVGIGFVMNGKVRLGSSQSAGEFQSILWEPGNEGQLSISDEQIKMVKNDRQIMQRAFHEVSSHMAFLINTMNFPRIIIGGEITDFKDILEPILQEEIQKNWSYPSRVECQIEFSSLGKNVVAYGAAGHHLMEYYSIPQITENYNGQT